MILKNIIIVNLVLILGKNIFCIVMVSILRTSSLSWRDDWGLRPEHDGRLQDKDIMLAMIWLGGPRVSQYRSDAVMISKKFC